MALEYDPDQRGGDAIFKQVIDLVNKSTIQVFYIETYELFSYEINDNTSLSDLRKRMHASTGIKPENQHLVLPNGEIARKDIGKQIMDSWYKPLHRFECNNPVVLFMFDISRELNYIEFYKNLTLPPRVEKMLLNPSQTMEMDEQRHTWRNSVWVAQQTLSKYYHLNSALRGCFMNCTYLYNKLQRENQQVALWVQSLLTSTGLMRKHVRHHVEQYRATLEKEKDSASHDHGICEQLDKRLDLIDHILATFTEFDKFKRENAYKLFEKSGKIVPKFSKDNAIIQQLLKSCEIDDSLREKYNDILSAYDSLRKRKKDEYGTTSNNNLMINLLCDCFKIIESLMKQMFDILLVAVSFMKNINVLTERSQAMQAIVGNWQKRIDGEHVRTWTELQRPLTDRPSDGADHDMPFMSRLNIGNEPNECVRKRLQTLEHTLEALNKFETNKLLVDFSFNPLEFYNLLL